MVKFFFFAKEQTGRICTIFLNLVMLFDLFLAKPVHQAICIQILIFCYYLKNVEKQILHLITWCCQHAWLVSSIFFNVTTFFGFSLTILDCSLFPGALKSLLIDGNCRMEDRRLKNHHGQVSLPSSFVY